MDTKTDHTRLSRRGFLAAGMAAPLVVPNYVVGATTTRQAPSDTLNIAAVGIGGMGKNYIKGCESENIVALADVDDKMAAPVFKMYPKAAQYRDYRKMLEKQKDIDAVIVGTPDHTHAVVAMAAVENGKHVYVAKPLTRTVREARTLAQAVEKAGVASQMSVQSCAGDPARKTAEWLRAGAVGQVREVHVWSDRPVWPQGIDRPKETPAVPGHLDWDLWLGPAPFRPWHPVYHPFNFRGWYDFGTGALGDMACHSFHAFFRELKLFKPASAVASIAQFKVPAEDAEPAWTRCKPKKYDDSFPPAGIVIWDYPERDGLPPLRMYWYDGGLRPPVPEGINIRATLRGDGVIFVGDMGAMLTGFTGGPMALSEKRKKDFQEPQKTLPRTDGHYMEWVNACKGGKPAFCEFGFGSKLTEVALLGALAQRTGEYLEWDAENGRTTNNEAANALIDPPYREGWAL